MYILDTDHLTILRSESQPAYGRLVTRLSRLPMDKLVTTIVNYQEQMQGWLALLNKANDGQRIVFAYEELQLMQQAFLRMRLLPFDHAAQERYSALRKQLRRMGTMDLRIACITLAHDATLLTRNRRDFDQVPELKVEDWTQE